MLGLVDIIGIANELGSPVLTHYVPEATRVRFFVEIILQGATREIFMVK
jgi:hypothetical protein